MNNLIDKVFSNENFPSWPRKQIGTQLVKNKEEPIYSFFLDQSDAYVSLDYDVSKFYTNAKVIKDCVHINFNNNKQRYVFWFSIFNLDEYFARHNKSLRGEFEQLMMATEYI